MPAVRDDRGHVRVSHLDREHVVEALKAAFVQGRLTKDEFDLRVGQALAARTVAELTALAADLPAGLAQAQQQPTTARVQLLARARRPDGDFDGLITLSGRRHFRPRNKYCRRGMSPAAGRKRSPASAAYARMPAGSRS